MLWISIEEPPRDNEYNPGFAQQRLSAEDLLAQPLDRSELVDKLQAEFDEAALAKELAAQNLRDKHVLESQLRTLETRIHEERKKRHTAWRLFNTTMNSDAQQGQIAATDIGAERQFYRKVEEEFLKGGEGDIDVED